MRQVCHYRLLPLPLLKRPPNRSSDASPTLSPPPGHTTDNLLAHPYVTARADECLYRARKIVELLPHGVPRSRS